MMTPAFPAEESAFVRRLTEIAGSDGVATGDQVTAEYTVDGLKPSVVVFASGAEAVAQVVKAGNQFQKTIVPWGSGSKQSVGACLSGADAVVSLKPMNNIIELDAGNYTLQVEAGIANRDLHRQMAEQGLSLPFDPFCTETSTIGGELATNVSGPSRAAYGTARDIVLGITAVSPTGDIIRTGGKTMKNVAGIDLCKLLIGSQGTLGIITDTVMRIFPQAEVNRRLLLSFPNAEDAFEVVARLLVSKLTPISVELVDGIIGHLLEPAGGPPVAENGVLLVVSVSGSREDAARHQKEISALAEENKAASTVILDGAEVNGIENAYRQAHQSLFAGASAVQGKASVPLSRQGEMFRAVKQTGDKYDVPVAVTVHGYNGILYTRFDASAADAPSIINDLNEAAAGLGGFFMMEAAPLRFRKNGVALPPRSDYKLMRLLKNSFDPQNILNPGKLIGGPG
jgi:glycolate oxidase